MAGEIVFTPDSYDFGKRDIKTIKTIEIIVTNNSKSDIVLKNITIPDGFEFEFINKYPAYQPYDFKSIYQDGIDIDGITYKGFKSIFIEQNQSGGSFKNISSKLIKLYIPYGITNSMFEINLTKESTSTLSIFRFTKPPLQYYENEDTGLTKTIYGLATNDYLTDVTTLYSIEQFAIPDPTNKTIKLINENHEPNSNINGWIYIIIRSDTEIENVNVTYFKDSTYFKLIDTSNWRIDGDPYDNVITSNTSTDPDTYNPTDYYTMEFPYTRMPVNLIDQRTTHWALTSGIKYNGYNGSTCKNEWKEYSRLFIPPGTIGVWLDFQSWNCSAKYDAFIGNEEQYFMIYRFNNTIEKIVYTCPFEGQETKSSYDDLIKKQDCHGFESDQGNSFIAHINLEALPYNKSGWMYFKWGGESIAAKYIFFNKCSLQVDVDKYNQWWDHGGGNTDGSVNWIDDIEKVETYNCPKYTEIVIQPSASIRNTTGFSSVNKPYYRIPNNLGYNYNDGTKSGDGVALRLDPPVEVTNFYFCSNNYNSATSFRMFIPPGTIKIDFYCVTNDISDNDNTKAIIRFNQKPTTNFTDHDNYIGQKYSLNKLMGNDCYSKSIGIDNDGIIIYKLHICEDSFYTAALTPELGGWLYIKTNKKLNGLSFQLTVDKYSYNVWWDKYGSNTDKSINWDNDVEIMTTYIPKSS